MANSLQTTPLTLERIEASLKRHGWKYQVKEGQQYIESFFDGFFFVFSAESPDLFFSVFSWGSGITLPKERFTEVQHWAAQWNTQSLIGTARPFVDGDVSVLRVDSSYFVEVGVTDEQIDEYLETAITCHLQAMNQYMQTFELKAPVTQS